MGATGPFPIYRYCMFGAMMLQRLATARNYKYQDELKMNMLRLELSHSIASSP